MMPATTTIVDLRLLVAAGWPRDIARLIDDYSQSTIIEMLAQMMADRGVAELSFATRCVAAPQVDVLQCCVHYRNTEGVAAPTNILLTHYIEMPDICAMPIPGTWSMTRQAIAAVEPLGDDWSGFGDDWLVVGRALIAEICREFDGPGHGD